jgi:hypothetical protein
MRSGAARKAGGVVTIRKASGDRIFTEIAYQHCLAWVTDSWPQQAAIGRVGPCAPDCPDPAYFVAGFRVL